MQKEKAREFAVRVAQGTRSELIVIMYEVILEDTAEARNWWDSGELQNYRRELKHAVRFVNELMKALDFHYRLSYELRSLYIYVNQLLIEADFSRKPEHLAEVERIIGALREAFLVVAEQDDSAPMMVNTQHLTAGLTYGKGSLNEVCLEDGIHGRGFLA